MGRAKHAPADTRTALAVYTIERHGQDDVQPGETFECPAADYDVFLKTGAIKPVDGDEPIDLEPDADPVE